VLNSTRAADKRDHDAAERVARVGNALDSPPSTDHPIDGPPPPRGGLRDAPTYTGLIRNEKNRTPRRLRFQVRRQGLSEQDPHKHRVGMRKFRMRLRAPPCTSRSLMPFSLAAAAPGR
jgi:hypothetical protein